MTSPPPLARGHVRLVIIDDAQPDHHLVLDYRGTEIATTLAALFTIGPTPVVDGPDGGPRVARFFDDALRHDPPHHHAAGLAAIWIVLHASDLPPAFLPDLDDVLATAGTGSVTIRISEDRRQWDYQIDNPVTGGGGGCVTLPPMPATRPPGTVVH